MVESQNSLGNRRTTRSAEDERFIESFKNYVDLLVDESCSEITGKKSVPIEKFKKAGKNLVDASRKLESSQTSHFSKLFSKLSAFIIDGRGEPEVTTNVKNFVGMLNDLAENRVVAPESGAICSTPSNNSIHKLKEVTGGLKNYFEKIGLTLFADTSTFNDGRPIPQLCLGEAQNIRLQTGPEIVIFTKTIISSTIDTIDYRALNVGGHYDWTDDEKIYHVLEPKLEYGKGMPAKLEGSSALKTLFAEKGQVHQLCETDKLRELAWTSLSFESSDKESFSKKYATTCIEDNYPHEVYHSEIAKAKSGSFAEAAAQLYAIGKGRNPLSCLRLMYWWKNGELHEYAHAAEEAFKQLEKAGYTESLWKEFDPKDTEKINAAGSKIRELADAALTNLETDLGWRSHKEVERELGLERNYSMLHKELQKLEAV